MLQAIKNKKCKNPLILDIKDEINKSQKTFTMIWTPAHIGIKGNEKADEEAKKATENETQSNKITTEDIYIGIKENAKKKWEEMWKEQKGKGNKLAKIRETTEKWKTVHALTKKDQVIITRLRIGHTRITHEYLLQKEPMPVCNCAQALTVEHIFDCTLTKSIRDKYKIEHKTLNTNSTGKLRKIIDYLKETEVYDQI